ncbi:unnamed protein product [Gongylonema pulchrum]|uniref:RRM domain-containing protein n=1 Tax=Gongylonema pulchrum TaxID=637853 RepID=A0A183D2N1_9BILA|nr:unnamed protein product [Gongylonema pulchrum]
MHSEDHEVVKFSLKSVGALPLPKLPQKNKVHKPFKVNFVELLEDRKGKSKGAAVIEFRERESVQRCVENLHRYPLKDRLLTAKEIRDPVAFFRKVKEDTGIDFLNSLHGGTAVADTRSASEEQFETYGLSPAFLRQLHITGPLTNRVFVSNVSFKMCCA